MLEVDIFLCWVNKHVSAGSSSTYISYRWSSGCSGFLSYASYLWYIIKGEAKHVPFMFSLPGAWTTSSSLLGAR